VAFSIAAHRCAMYPPDHPSLLPAVENVVTGLSNLLRVRGTLSLGIGQNQLVIDDVATDEGHPVLSDLARRLHNHQLGAVVFTRGLTREEFLGFLATIAEEPERGGNPIGLVPEGLRPTWEHIAIRAIGYDQLEMAASDAGGDSKKRSGQLWIQLARSAMGSAAQEEVIPSVSALAGIIRGRKNDPEYDKSVVGHLVELAAELKWASGTEAEKVREKVSRLIRELDRDTVQRIVRLGAGWIERRQLVLNGSRGGLAPDVMVSIASAVAAEEDRAISPMLSRLLTKLTQQAEQGAEDLRSHADTALRETIEGLTGEMEPEGSREDPHPVTLDQMAIATPLFSLAPEAGAVNGATRTLQMALEVDAFGPTVESAVSELLELGRFPQVLQLVTTAPKRSSVAGRLRVHLMTPVQLRQLLSGEDVEERSLRLLVNEIGESAIEPLFQFLAESDSHAIRRKVFDALASMTVGGERVAALAAERTRHDMWYVKRNMLALLQRVETLPEDFTPVPFLLYHDPRVRREAFPLAIRIPEARERALSLALSDSDERIVRMALLELQTGVPEALVPVIANRILNSRAFPTLRSLAVRALEEATSPLALDTLIGICSTEKTIFGRPKLNAKSPELLAAIGVLARRWRGDPRADAMIALAEKSQDLQIVTAARSGAPVT